MDDNKIDFGPTETLQHIECPTLRRFEKKWQQPGPWMPHMSMGAAFSAALAIYMFEPTDEKFKEANHEGITVLKQRFEDNDDWSLEGLQTLFEKGFSAIRKGTLAEILKDEDVVACQKTIGRGRLDLLTRHKSTGKLIVTDDKSKLKLDSRWVEKEINSIQHDWQLWDYSARVQEEYGEHPEWFRRHLIVLSPRARGYLSTPVRVKLLALEYWKANRELIFQEMAEQDLLPFNKVLQRTEQCIHPRYGSKCRAYDACHNLYRDEEAMAKVFIPRKRG